MPVISPTSYNMGYAASSLRPELARIVAEHFVDAGNWKDARIRILSTNALQCRNVSSSLRTEREIRSRLSSLTQNQITLLSQATSDDRVALTWLAVCKYNAFVFEFAAEVLREKLADHDPILRLSDYESFVDIKSVSHPELAHLSVLFKNKIRHALFKMLSEAGILSKGSELGTIHRPVISPLVKRAIASDNSQWLAAFLVPDSELGVL